MEDNPSLKICDLPIDTLKPYERNARTHSNKQIRQIADSMGSFGFTNPVLIDRHSTIIAGHGRVLAAKLLGRTSVPTICLEGLTEDQVRAYILADNKLAEKAGWDKSILAIELQHLLTIETDIDISVTGFEEAEIDLIINGGADQDDDDDTAPDLAQAAISQIGDLWRLGNHRVLCGDATSPEAFSILMNGSTAAMAFTDPPYNVDYAGQEDGGKHRKILNDALGDNFSAFLLASFTNLLKATDGAIYACMSSSELHVLQAAFLQAGGHWSTFLIWAKNTFTLGRSDYQRQYEPILYGWREGSKHQWCGARDQGDVWYFDKPARNDLHPTMKPVALVKRAIRNSSKKGDIVLDPFLGSGTTVIAAERVGRTCYGLELDPLYVDAIVKRWQKLTGKDALHAATGKTFNQTMKGVMS